MTHLGQGQRRGLEPCGCVAVVFGKPIKVLQSGAVWNRKNVKACDCAGGAALIVPKGEQ